MKKLLTLKHWQLFLLLIILPLILEFIITGTTMANNSKAIITIFPIIMILMVGIYFGWLYSLGVNLHRILPSMITMSLRKFRTFLLIPVIYLTLISIYMLTLPFGNTTGKFNPAIFLIILPLHLLSMFCIFYCLYFVAKALKAGEWQRPVTFSDYVGELFLIWFFPIGVWLLQPRINKLFDNPAKPETE